ncbi:MAG: M13 family metallopeptidase [Betaproteobacteria bacterium]
MLRSSPAPVLRLATLAASAALACGATFAQAVGTQTTTTIEKTTTTQSVNGVVSVKTEKTQGTTVAPVLMGSTAAPTTLLSGIDLHGMDGTVRPQDDLFLAMNGGWLKATEIPSDKAAWGNGAILRELSDTRQRTLVEGLVARTNAAGSNAQKVADFYRAYVDEAAIDQAGLAPVSASLKEVDALADKHALAALVGRWQGVANMPVLVEVFPDFKDPGRYAAAYGQAGLGLPDRDYYLQDEPRMAQARAAYLVYLAQLFSASGDAQADAHAALVMALEKRIATAQWKREDMRDPVRTYNPMKPAELAMLAPGLDWPALAVAAQVRPEAIVDIEQPSYLAALAAIVDAEPLSTWKLYLKARRLDDAATVLPLAFRQARFQFRGQALQGLKTPPPRWQNAMHELDAGLGEALGELYVAQYFPPESRARAQALVANLMKAYAASIDGLAWMSPATKAAAQLKLSQYTVKIGYPDQWRDYGALSIRVGDALGNSDRAGQFAYRRNIVRVGGPVERGEWDMTPQTVNAYYNPSGNEIVFPAAILQPPYFDPRADDAVNYGGIGAVIGHEISHGFDDQGSQFDGLGRLRDWWTADDRKAFDAITKRLVAQYSAYEPLPGHHVNGQLTLGENIADLSGLQIAYKAYKISLAGKPSPVIDGLTGEQRFFYGWAQGWRSKTRDARAQQLLTTNEHSPAQFRGDGAPINSDGFHEAFGTKPGDAMWKAPADRIRLW